MDAGEKSILCAPGIRVLSTCHIDEHGMRAAMNEAMKDLDEDTHLLHVSFDVDRADLQYAPGRGNTRSNGASWREVRLCIKRIAATELLDSLDIVEFNPRAYERNSSAAIVVDLIESLFSEPE